VQVVARWRRLGDEGVKVKGFKAVITIAIRLRHDNDTTMPRVHDAFDYDGSDRNYDSTAIRLRQDYDEKSDMLIFCLRRTRRCQSLGSRRGTAYAAYHDSWSAASTLHDVIVTSQQTWLLWTINDKEVEYLINLYQSERSIWDSNDECYYDANKRLQGLDRIRTACQ